MILHLKHNYNNREYFAFVFKYLISSKVTLTPSKYLFRYMHNCTRLARLPVT